MNNEQRAPEQRAAMTPLEDLRQAALKHYDEVTTAAHCWRSEIPKAINFYFDYLLQQPTSERFRYEAELKNRYSDAVQLLRQIQLAFCQIPLHFRLHVAAPVVADYERQAKRVAAFLDEVASKPLSQTTSERCGECVWHRPDIETDGPCWWTTCGSQVVTNPIKFCPFCGQVIALQGVEEIAQPNI